MNHLDDLLQKLKKAKHTPNGWMALCPAHSDANRSLSVAEKNGKILLHCFAGCKVHSIVGSLGLQMSDLFEANGLHVNPPPPVQAKTITAIYEYFDADGTLSYENVRYHPKGFTQRRPDGNGGYIYNLQGVTRIPYRLPEIIQATKTPDAEIWLCEGEKDAESVRSLGFAASSFKTWTDDFNQYVKSAHVVLFSDHDTAGQKQAADAANILSGNCLSVKVIGLFDGEPLPKKNGKDISDYIQDALANGKDNIGIAERLCQIVEGAEVWTATQTTGQTVLQSDNLFTLRAANEWIMDAKTRPIPKTLFGEFWFENELCILFADTGKGKSILAVQIGESIASGQAIKGFTQTALAQRVLYFDFELSDKQFESRYSEKPANSDYHTNHFVFSPNLFRLEINPDADLPQGVKFEDFLIQSIEDRLKETGSKVVVLDNITYLRSDTERAKDALPLMKELKRLKTQYDLSILALAHTPKRDLSRPITVNDLSGSKMLSNFADSIFAIGESQKDHIIRYLKQIKTRSAETMYHADNVCICQIEKPTNFLQFQFLDFGKEKEHLLEVSQKDKDELIQKAHDLHSQGKTQREIANELNVSLGKVNKMLNTLKANAANP